MRVLPIIFKTDMIRAILDGRKTVTRRPVKYKYSNTEMKMRTDKYGTRLVEIQKDVEGETYGKNEDGSTWHKLRGYIEPKPPYQPGDILYVRETWKLEEFYEDEAVIVFKDGLHQHIEYEHTGQIYQKLYKFAKKPGWIPNIHMPKAAARIWLKVTDVRVERLQDMSYRDFLREGITVETKGVGVQDIANQKFRGLWDSTIKKSDLALYGWNANPWVWVIEFERCEKPEEENNG